MNNLRKFYIIGLLKGLNFYVPIFTLFMLGNGVSLPDIIYSQVFYSAVSFLGEIPTGLFADKFGQRASIILGYLTEAFGISLILLFPTSIGIYAAFSIRGVAHSFLSGSEEALFYESHKKELPSGNFIKDYGNFLSLNVLGFMLASFLAGIFLQFFKQSSYPILIILSVVGILAAALMAVSLKSFQAEIRKPLESAKMWDSLRESLKFVRSNRTIFALTIVSVLTINGEYFLAQVYQPLFENLKVIPFWIGFALTIASFLNFLFRRYSYLLEKFFSLGYILLGYNFLIGVLFIGIAMITSPLLAVIIFISLQSLFNIEAPIVSDYINQDINPEIRSTVLSTVSFAETFASIITRILLGLLTGIIGLKLTLALQGIYLIIGILIGFYILVKCGCTHRISKHAQTI